MTELLVRRFIQNADDTSSPAVRQAYGRLSGLTGILLNLLLASGKFLAGLLTGAISITADAFNNLSDAASSVVTLVGFQMAGKKADADHPFGHGRMEYLSGLFVSVLILLVGWSCSSPRWKRFSTPPRWTFPGCRSVSWPSQSASSCGCACLTAG